MKRMANNRKKYRMLSLVLAVCMLLGLAVQAAAAPAAVTEPAANTSSVDLETARAALNEERAKAGLVQADAEELDPNQVVRVMVETTVAPAVEQTMSTTYAASVQQAEQQALREQAAVIERVEAVTGTELLSQSAYLVSVFTIEMKAGQMAEVAKLPGVASVTPVTLFELNINHATQMTTVSQMWEELG